MSKTKKYVVAGLGFLLLLGAGTLSAWAQCPLIIDDFTTGKHKATLKVIGTFSDATTHDVDFQSGSMVGGSRLTDFFIASNPFNHEAFLDIQKGGPLIFDTGTRVGARLDVVYGKNPPAVPGGPQINNPLNLNISGCDRLRVVFDSNDTPLNFNILVFWAGGAFFAQSGKNLGPLSAATPWPGPTNVDFLFTDFVTFGTPVDWTDIDFISLIFQPANGIGGQDFAVISFSARSGP